MALILLHVTAPLHLNSLLGLVPKKRRRKTLSFLFTSLLVAIKTNDSGLCDNEIPPSLLTAGVTYLPMSRWLFAARLRLTYVDTHGKLHEVHSTAAAEGTKHWQMPTIVKKIGNKKSGTFSVPTSEQAWISRIMNPKMGDYWLDGLLFMKSYSLCHVKSTYQFMELAYSWSQTHSAIHSNIA